MPVNGTDVYLNPGMMVTAEIKTGRRKLIDYFLSPLIQKLPRLSMSVKLISIFTRVTPLPP